MHKYRLVAKKGEGTFSEVLKAQCIKNGKYVAIKCMKNHFDSLDQVNNLREIQALRRLSPHANIIKLLEVLYDQPTGRLALVFELMDMNIYELIRGRRHYVAEERIKSYMYQLIKSMDHMHRNGIFHRDIKPENILICDDELKLADFGSCRGIYSKQPYTEYISTRWYRAPECLLTDGFYNYKMDMWGVGCVFFEVLSLYPLFPGTNELDQIQKIHNIMGTPNAEILAKMKKHSNSHIDFNFPFKEGSPITKLIPHASSDCSDLISKLLCYNPDERISAKQALRHPYFRDLRDAEKRAYSLSLNPSPSPSMQHEHDAAESTTSKKSKAGAEEHEPDKNALPSIRKTVSPDDTMSKASITSHNHPMSSSLPHVNTHLEIGNGHTSQQEDTSSLPPINPMGGHIQGGHSMHQPQNMMASLKIDSKSIHSQSIHSQKNMQPKSQKIKQKQLIKGTKGMVVQSKSYEKFGTTAAKLPNSGFQSAVEGAHGDEYGIASKGGKKSYVSPYSQRFIQKQKVPSLS